MDSRYLPMFYAVLPLFLLTLCALSLAVLLNRQFAHTLAPVVFGVMLVLYGFYISGALALGRMVVVGLCLIPAAACAVPSLRKQGPVQVVKSRDFLLYLAAVAVFFLFSWNKFVSLWDCLRLWGAYPKALHTDPSLQLGESSVLFHSMQSYAPGMPLLCYFFTSFSPVFPENVLFFTYSFFGFSLMLPFLADTEGKTGKQLAWLLAAVLFIPWMVTGLNDDAGQYYSSLFIDIPLGICCGYCLWRAFHRLGADGFDSVCVVLSCGVLALLKDSGSFMALCGILGGLCCCILDRKDRPLKRSLPWLALAGLVLGLTYGSWKYLLNLYSVSNHLSIGFAIPGLVTLARIFFQFIRTPISGFYSITGSIQFSLPGALLILFAAKLLLGRYNEKAKMSLEIADVAWQTICYALFFLGYCLCFLSEIMTQFYPSYIRYFCTLVIAALYILAADCKWKHPALLAGICAEWKAFSAKGSILSRLISSGAALARWAAVIAMVFASVLILFDFPSRQDDFCVQASRTAGILAETVEEGADVYLCIPGNAQDTARLHHRTYFELIDDGIRVKNYFDAADITDTGMGYTSETFLDVLISQGYDYVMLTSLDDAIVSQFPELFADASVEDTHLLYKVDAQFRQLIRIQ